MCRRIEDKMPFRATTRYDNRNVQKTGNLCTFHLFFLPSTFAIFICSPKRWLWYEFCSLEIFYTSNYSWKLSNLMIKLSLCKRIMRFFSILIQYLLLQAKLKSLNDKKLQRGKLEMTLVQETYLYFLQWCSKLTSSFAKCTLRSLHDNWQWGSEP